MERGAGWVCRRPRTTTALAAVLTIAMGWAATGIRFDTNIFDLLPRGAESVRYQNRMIMDSDLSPIFNMAVADDIASAAEILMGECDEAVPFALVRGAPVKFTDEPPVSMVMPPTECLFMNIFAKFFTNIKEKACVTDKIEQIK